MVQINDLVWQRRFLFLWSITVLLLLLDVFGQGRWTYRNILSVYAYIQGYRPVVEEDLALFSSEWQNVHNASVRVVEEVALDKTGEKVGKMRGLRAARAFTKGETVASYAVEVVPKCLPREMTYALALYAKKGKGLIKEYTGVPTLRALEVARSQRAIEREDLPSAVGLFANEPTLDEKPNSYLKFPEVDALQIQPYTVVWAYLKAAQPIREGEKILWCYGKQYHRQYTTSCAHE